MSAGQELTQLEPALAAVREAWEPYAQPIRDLGHELDTVLRPEAWRAHRDVRRAGLGHQHAAQRRASDATHAVDQAEADIAAIRRDAAPIEHHLDQLEHHASTFRTRAGRDHELDLRDQRELRQLDQILDAADTYTVWMKGRPVPTARLSYAIEILSEVARQAPSFARHPGEPERSQWHQLLDRAPDRPLGRDLSHGRGRRDMLLQR